MGERHIVVAVGAAVAQAVRAGVARRHKDVDASGLEQAVEARPDDGVEDLGVGGDAAAAAGAIAERELEVVRARHTEIGGQEAARKVVGAGQSAHRRVESATGGFLPATVGVDRVGIVGERGWVLAVLGHEHLDRDAGVALALADLVETAFEVRLRHRLRADGRDGEHGESGGDDDRRRGKRHTDDTGQAAAGHDASALRAMKNRSRVVPSSRVVTSTSGPAAPTWMRLSTEAPGGVFTVVSTNTASGPRAGTC